jgi:hypothetical protein
MKRVVCVAGVLALFLALCSESINAGAKGGQKRWKATIKAKGELEYKIFFDGGKYPQKYAEFACIGNGKTDVDLFVYDADGGKVGADELFTDIAVVRWPVKKAQEYRIVLKNLGDEDNELVLAHN